MFSKKQVLSIVLAAVVLVSASNLYETADKLLTELKTVVKNTLDTNVPELELLPAELAAVGNAVLAPAQTDIAEVRDDLIKQVNLLYPEARELGYINLGILDLCIANYKPEIEILGKFIGKEVEFCIENTIREGDALVNRTISTLKDIENVPQMLDLRLQECGLDGSNECIIPLIEVIAVEIVDLPATIKEETTKAKVVARTLEQTFSSCANDRIASMPSLGQRIIVYIRLCAQMPV